MDSSSHGYAAAAEERDMAQPGTHVSAGPNCPRCGADFLRPTNLPGRYRCISCLRRFELRSDCPDCGNHATIARMTDTANVTCRNCGGSMLREI
jgi:predicted nucleic acid-binding Zn ribbon protein